MSHHAATSARISIGLAKLCYIVWLPDSARCGGFSDECGGLAHQFTSITYPTGDELLYEVLFVA